MVLVLTVESPNSHTPNSNTYPNSHTLFGLTKMWLFADSTVFKSNYFYTELSCSGKIQFCLSSNSYRIKKDSQHRRDILLRSWSVNDYKDLRIKIVKKWVAYFCRPLLMDDSVHSKFPKEQLHQLDQSRPQSNFSAEFFLNFV